MRATTELAWCDPVDVFAPLADRAWSRLLHSPDGAHDARWSLIVTDPAHCLVGQGDGCTLDGKAVSSPFDVWASLCRARWSPDVDGPFRTGAVGFVGYEAAKWADAAAPRATSPGTLPWLEIGFYDAALVFDRRARTVHLHTRGSALGNATLVAAHRRALRHPENRPHKNILGSPLLSDASAEVFSATVARAIDRILSGDFFQTNVTRMLSADLAAGVHPYDVFGSMLALDAAPMAAFVASESGWAASISPERFFRVTPVDGQLTICAFPVKGTAPRSNDPVEDAARATALLGSEKDRAENVMIVDLLRNDLSRVCADHSVDTPTLCALRSYASVHHLESRVQGTLRSKLNAVDALRATFPCGSITGAPKVEAMRFIAAVEGRGRGLYTGAIGYIDDGGAADFSVAIRTAEFCKRPTGIQVLYGVGGGITALSDPNAEYIETCDKAATFVRATERARADAA